MANSHKKTSRGDNLRAVSDSPSSASVGPRAIAEAVEQDPRWVQLVERDAGARFFYSVRSTGIFCRPTCGSRRPRPENVRFHASVGDAERAGFRACLRCRPTEASLAARQAVLVADACRHIEQAAERPALEQLAARAQLSPHHFHRLFKAVTGLAPMAYADAHRAGRLRDGLSRGQSVTRAAQDAGFNSSGHLHTQSKALLGMTASRFRKGGVGAVVRFAVGECSLGAILVAASERGICDITLGDDPALLVQQLQERFAQAELIGDDADFARTIAIVIGFIESPGIGLSLPLDIQGTAFQQRVWQALRDIPVGSTLSYSELAARIDSPRAVRAVAQACASNRIAVAIPCHRIVRSNGDISGYRWGVERKRDLLDREQKAGCERAGNSGSPAAD